MKAYASLATLSHFIFLATLKPSDVSDFLLARDHGFRKMEQPSQISHAEAEALLKSWGFKAFCFPHYLRVCITPYGKQLICVPPSRRKPTCFITLQVLL